MERPNTPDSYQLSAMAAACMSEFVTRKRQTTFAVKPYNLSREMRSNHALWDAVALECWRAGLDPATYMQILFEAYPPNRNACGLQPQNLKGVTARRVIATYLAEHPAMAREAMRVREGQDVMSYSASTLVTAGSVPEGFTPVTQPVPLDEPLDGMSEEVIFLQAVHSARQLLDRRSNGDTDKMLEILRSRIYDIDPMVRLALGWPDPEVLRVFGHLLQELMLNRHMRLLLKKYNMPVDEMLEWYRNNHMAKGAVIA